MSFFEDELDESDLKFLKQWGQIGQSDTADAEYAPETDIYEEVGEGEEAEVGLPSDNGSSDSEIDESIEGDKESGKEGDRIDESKMDLSDIDSGSDSTHGDPEGEDEPELEAPEEGDDRLSDISNAEDDELDFEDEDDDYDTELSDKAENRDQLKEGDTDSDIPEGESDLEYDGLDDEESEDGDAQVEDEFKGDKRANTESEIDDLDKYERQRDEAQDSEDDLDEPDISDADDDVDDLHDEHDSDSENTELDAEEPDGNPNDEELNDPVQETINYLNEKHEQELNAEDELEFKDDSHFSNEQHEELREKLSEAFSDLPEAGDYCENHCEDNDDDDDEHEECEHCRARLEKERELWGVVAQDKHDNDLLPGDKVRVVIPMPFTTLHSILAVNVPNLDIDPQRVAQSTAGEIDSEVCWLSGHSMSNFTGWHMSHNGAIWTFKKGKKLRFAEKISEPEFQRHGSNDLDGDQLDTEDMIEKFKEELENGMPEDEGEPELESDDEEEKDDVDDSGTGEDSEGEGGESDGAGEDDDLGDDQEDAEPESSEDESEELEEHRRRNSDLTGTQKQRFESLVNRITEKVKATFGNTLEGIQVCEVVDRGLFVECDVWIQSRGMQFAIKFSASRAELEDG